MNPPENAVPVDVNVNSERRFTARENKPLSADPKGRHTNASRYGGTTRYTPYRRRDCLNPRYPRFHMHLYFL